MRLSARDLQPAVVMAPDTARPIRLRVAGLTFMFSGAEAMDLAAQLADAVTELKSHDRRTS